MIFAGCLVLAGLAGCGAPSSGMVARRRPAGPPPGEGLADRGLPGESQTASASGVTGPGQGDDPPTVVIGFVGGFVRHTDRVHSPVQVAARLRESFPSGVYVEVFENSHREEAHRRILAILGKAGEGKLSDRAKRQARIIIYGMSWGGSETVALARQLQADRIPVLLTVQVDSVAKAGQNDQVIPANVAEAANFYQTDGLLHGRAQIRAEKGAGTRIVGNFHYQYKKTAPHCDEYPWYDRLFAKYHTKIECDPEVWGRVETLIRAKLPPAADKASGSGPRR